MTDIVAAGIALAKRIEDALAEVPAHLHALFTEAVDHLRGVEHAVEADAPAVEKTATEVVQQVEDTAAEVAHEAVPVAEQVVHDAETAAGA